MNKNVRLLLVGIFAFATACAAAPRVREIFPQKAYRIAQSTDILIIDVRSVEEYLSGHIELSLSVPADQLKSRPHDIPKDKRQPILLVCDNGLRAKSAAGILADMGYTDVYALLGGINSWRAAGHPVYKYD